MSFLLEGVAAVGGAAFSLSFLWVVLFFPLPLRVVLPSLSSSDCVVVLSSLYPFGAFSIYVCTHTYTYSTYLHV